MPANKCYQQTRAKLTTVKKSNNKFRQKMAAAAPAAAASDRFLALKEFDESKSGVKGLVDSGITSLPPIFVHPNLTLSPSASRPRRLLSIPTIDLSLPRPVVTELVRSAARTFGFFHVINHRVPLPLLDRAISAVHSFHELPSESRSRHYSREFRGGFSYASNFDLFRSAAANWRDTFQIQLGPVRADPAQIPEACREELMSLEEHVTELGREVTGILAEGLGAERGRLEEISCCEGRTITGNYYPWCPEPEKTAGMTAHTDPGVVTVLAQDMVGGLQVKLKGDEEWVDVVPVPGALIINLGDLLQIISNDEYKSVEHRVTANSHREARVSIAVFFSPGKRGESDFYGPLPELVSREKPAVYRNFTMPEFLGNFFNRGLVSKCMVDHFKF